MSRLNPSAAFAAFVLATLAGAGCTLQEAKDEETPPPAAPPVAASTAAASGAPVAAAPEAGAPADGHAHGEGDGHDHGPAAPPAPVAGGAMSGGPMSGAPMMSMGGNPAAPLTPNADLDKKIAEAEKAGDKKKIAAAYAERGTFRMNDEKAGPRVKYRAALDDYRMALQMDPANAEAKQNKEQIESIYKSMGRPVPGEGG